MVRKTLSLKEINYIKKQIPLNKLGTMKDISNAAIFLCSKNNQFITGQNLIVDGGFSETINF